MPEFRDLADLFADLGATIASPLPVAEAMSLITAAGVTAIAGAEAAAVTRGRTGQFETIAATSQLAVQVDAIQFELTSGPCVDTVLEESVFHSVDLRTEPRWPEFAERAVAETEVRSMLSFRMFFEHGDLVAALTLYATKPDAFDDFAQTTGLVLATHGALALAGATRLERIENLEKALLTNRDIGVAVGILMTRHLASKQQAFDLLRVASQDLQRKLADVAQDVIESGDLAYPVQHALGSARRAAGHALADPAVRTPRSVKSPE